MSSVPRILLASSQKVRNAPGLFLLLGCLGRRQLQGDRRVARLAHQAGAATGDGLQVPARVLELDSLVDGQSAAAALGHELRDAALKLRRALREPVGLRLQVIDLDLLGDDRPQLRVARDGFLDLGHRHAEDEACIPLLLGSRTEVDRGDEAAEGSRVTHRALGRVVEGGCILDAEPHARVVVLEPAARRGKGEFLLSAGTCLSPPCLPNPPVRAVPSPGQGLP